MTVRKWKTITSTSVQNGWLVQCTQGIPGKTELPTTYVARTAEELATLIRSLADETREEPA